MRKHDQSSAAAAGARRAAAERDRKGRCSARRKRATVLRGVGALIQRGGRAVAGMLTIATAGGS